MNVEKDDSMNGEKDEANEEIQQVTKKNTLCDTVTDEKKEPFNLKKEILSWIIIAVFAYIIAKGVTNHVIIKAIIPSNSMENTIMTGDKIIGNRLAFLFSKPKRGDIVIFKFPDDETKNYIKRVIGLPGETIEIHDGGVYIYTQDGSSVAAPLVETYMKEEMDTIGVQSFTVPENCYFMLGDNRNTSLDARYWEHSYVEKEKILGKAWFRFYPNLEILK